MRQSPKHPTCTRTSQNSCIEGKSSATPTLADETLGGDDIQDIDLSDGFTTYQEKLFHHWHEEGFNVFTDSDYVRWLHIHQPESLPPDTSSGDLSLCDDFSSILLLWKCQ